MRAPAGEHASPRTNGGGHAAPSPVAAPSVRGGWAALRFPRAAAPWTSLTGLLALALIAALFVSGAAMTFYYSPTPGVAYDSVDHAQFNMPFGDVVRGVHVYAWNLLLVVVVLHLLRAFVAGAYTAPWRGAWLSAVAAVLLVPVLIVTGDLLPWNQSGYWSTRVRLGIASSVPIAGDLVTGLLRGGNHLGIVSLTRFYVLHILFLPCALLALLAVHVVFVARGLRSSAGSAGADAGRRLALDLTARGLLVFLVVIVALGLASSQFPAPLGDPADPTDTSYVPRPEWWALALNQLVTICRGALVVIPTVLLPGALLAFSVALPFIDLSAERRKGRRRTVMLATVALAAVLAGLAVMGYIEHYVDVKSPSSPGR